MQTVDDDGEGAVAGYVAGRAKGIQQSGHDGVGVGQSHGQQQQPSGRTPDVGNGRNQPSTMATAIRGSNPNFFISRCKDITFLQNGK